MSDNNAPLIALGGDAEAPVISYNVPEPTSYSGKNVIELTIPEPYFTQKAFEVPEVVEDDSGDANDDSPTGGTLDPQISDILDITVGVVTGDPEPPDPPGPPGNLPGPGDIIVPDLDPPEFEGPEPSTPSRAAVGTRRGATGSSRTGGRRISQVTSLDEIVDPTAIDMTVTFRHDMVAWHPIEAGGFDVVSSRPLSRKASELTPITFLTYVDNGLKPVLQKNLYGTYDWDFIPLSITDQPQPKLLLVESYRLSSFLGAYGAGRTIKTYSLYPGEETTMSVTSFRNTDESYRSTSSILDSVTEESSQEFEETLESEQSDRESSEKSSEYHADAEVNANWGWGSASVSGGTSSESSSTREEFAKNVSSATEKSAMSASAKRDVQVETSFEVSTQTGEETSIERRIQNINAGRTLNFVFRQMNQEFITLLHLTDARVGFFNGYNATKKETTLPKLAAFLAEYIKPEHIDETYGLIKSQLENIFDYQGNHHSFVEEKTLEDPDGNVVADYLRARVDQTMSYRNEATGTNITVPGVVIKATTSVLRTEGVIVESLMGIAPALDEYSSALQSEKVREKAIGNQALKLENKKTKQALEIIDQNDAERAQLYTSMFGAVVSEPDGGEA